MKTSDSHKKPAVVYLWFRQPAVFLSSMIFLIYGEDTCRSQRKLEEITNRYKANGGFGLEIKEAGETDFSDLRASLKQQSMFGGKKLVVLKKVFCAKTFKESFLENGKEVADSKNAVVIHEPGKVLASDPLFLFLKKNAKTEEFPLLGGLELKKWIKQESEKNQAKISEKAVEKLIELVGNDPWRITSELKKLACYSFPALISDKDVCLMVKPIIDPGIFATIDAIAEKNFAKALRLVREQLDKGESPLYLLSMINFQFRNILATKDLLESGKPYSSLPKLMGLHPFVVRKSYSQAAKFTLKDLKAIYRKIFQLDADTKKGRVDPSLGLEILIAEICSPAPTGKAI